MDLKMLNDFVKGVTATCQIKFCGHFCSHEVGSKRIQKILMFICQELQGCRSLCGWGDGVMVAPGWSLMTARHGVELCRWPTRACVTRFAPARWRNPKLHHWIWAIPSEKKASLMWTDGPDKSAVSTFVKASSFLFWLEAMPVSVGKHFVVKLSSLVIAASICQVIFTSIDGRTFGVALHFALLWEFGNLKQSTLNAERTLQPESETKPERYAQNQKNINDSIIWQSLQK